MPLSDEDKQWILAQFRASEERILKVLCAVRLDSRLRKGLGRMPTVSAREQMVLKGVYAGLSNKEIAAKLAISESTVKGVMQQLFYKAGVRTRAQLVRVALQAEYSQLA